MLWSLKQALSGQHAHKILLGFLLFVILISPMVQDFTKVSWIMSALFILVMLAAVRTMADRKTHQRTAFVLAFIAIYGQVGFLYLPGPWMESIRDLFTALFLFAVSLVLLRNILIRSQLVTADLIVGAINVYLMVGMAFTFLFAYLELIHPGSFAGLNSIAAGSERPVDSFLYFSYVTLSTLGYGDVTPVTDMATTLSYVEAIFGQLYLAILVARLVGLFVMGKSQSS
jgi:voltage-gated potassium channel